MESLRDLELKREEGADLFAPYFPACALGLLSAELSPGVRELNVPAGVMLADIAGFTHLSQRLADYSPGAPEQLRDILNRCFGTLVDIIHRRGGDVSHFAGDAVLALWPADGSEAGLRSQVLGAISCAVQISRELQNVAVTPDFRLQLRLAVSAGQIRLVSVGGVDGRWKFMVAGTPLRDIAIAARRATPGEVAILPEIRSLLGESTLNEARRSNALRSGTRDELVGVTPRFPSSSSSGRDALLAPYLPRALRNLIAAGQREWIGEYRLTTTMFVRIPDVDEESAGALARLQLLATVLQRSVYRYDGTVNQLLADDKGTILVAAWGLSRHSHEDDASRAVKSGLLIRKELAQDGISCGIGIATGRVFVGTRGTLARLDYGLIGDSVNLAARLMESTDSILCDSATRTAARREIIFESLPPVPLRGRSMPVPGFRPLQERSRRRDGSVDVVGRLAERAQLSTALASLEHDRRPGLIIIEGQPGIGKSILARDLMARTQSSTVRGIVANGNALERGTPFFAWRSVFARLLDVHAGALTDGDLAADVAERLISGLSPELRSRAGLLQDLLSINMAGYGTVDQLSPIGRADATRTLAAEILRQSAQKSPLLIVVEDAQWLDSASWGLVDAIRATDWPILLLILSRPFPGEELPAEYRTLIQDPAAVRLRLEPLQREDALAVACNRLQVEELPNELATLIDRKAEGHPLFVEELVRSLADRDLIAVRGGDCSIVGNRESLGAATISDTVQGVITSRIDQLTPAQQLTLKVASVLGRQFSVSDLTAIHPLGHDGREILQQLNVMEEVELVRALPSPGEYLFHHATIEEVAYDLLPLAQRRGLHAATAGRYQELPAHDSPRSLALLAHHWTRAGTVTQALDALDRAGERALRSGAFPEALLFLHQALDLAGGRAEVPASRLARWERLLCRAYFGTGDAVECRRYGESSCARLGRPVPRGAFRLAAGIARELLRWLAKTVSSVVHRGKPAGSTRQQVTRAFHALSYAYYLDQERAALLYSVLMTVNNAEGSGPSGELGRGYAALAYMAGAYGFARLAVRLQKRALRVAAALERPLVRADVLYISALSRVSNGQWDALRADMAAARALFESLGEIRSLLDVQLLESYAAYNTGNLSEAARAYADLRVAAARVSADRNEYLAASWEAGTALRRGRLDGCLSAVRSAATLPRERGAELSLLGFSALASLRSGDLVKARRTADQAGALIAAHAYTAPYSFEGYRDVADVYLLLWEKTDRRGPEAESFRRAASAISQALLQFARGCAIARPSALWIQGRYDALLGRRRSALRRWSRALELVIELGLPFEEGLIRRELARACRDAASRRSHYLAASALFERLGARYELSRLEEP